MPTAATAPSTSLDEEAGRPVLDQLGHRAAPEGDHGRAAGHRLDDAVPERLVESDQVQQRVRATEQLRTIRARSPGRRYDTRVPVDPGGDQLVEVLLILDDPGDHERHPGARGDVDRLDRSLVGWIRPKKSR